MIRSPTELGFPKEPEANPALASFGEPENRRSLAIGEQVERLFEPKNTQLNCGI